MKQTDRRKYVSAMLPVVGARCKGKSWPVIMDGMALLNEACRRSELPHSYGSGQSKQVVADLFEELDKQCFAHQNDDSFPIKALKCTESLIRKFGHGKQLVVDDIYNAEFYRERAYARKTDGFGGFVFFGKDAISQHPIVAAGEMPRSRAVKTEAIKINGRVEKLLISGRLSEEDAEVLRIGSSKTLIR